MTVATMVAATSAKDFILLIVWYNTRVFLCRKKREHSPQCLLTLRDEWSN
jgi:hypothetical protein